LPKVATGDLHERALFAVLGVWEGAHFRTDRRSVDPDR
jgi:hypothetical protein